MIKRPKQLKRTRRSPIIERRAKQPEAPDPKRDQRAWVELMDDLVGGVREQLAGSGTPPELEETVPHGKAAVGFDVKPTEELVAERYDGTGATGPEISGWMLPTQQSPQLEDLPPELRELAVRTRPDISLEDVARAERREPTVTRSLVSHPSLTAAGQPERPAPDPISGLQPRAEDFDDDEPTGTMAASAPVAEETATGAGVMFGNYRLLRRLKAGGMGEVYQGVFTGLAGVERPVAIKRILLPFTEVDDFIRMFIAEAKLTVQLNHAAIVQVLELGQVDDEYFIAMEYVHGHDVAAVTRALRAREEPIAIPVAVHIAQQVLEGLDHAHRKCGPNGAPLDIVHRDVTPSNILCSFEGQVKLTDFGVARATAMMSQTSPAALVGKLGYMSPEQLEDRPVDHRSDLFSLGVVLHELLTGQPLFEAESEIQAVVCMLEEPIPRVRARRPDIPEELEQVVMTALQRDPERRFAWASEMGEALQRVMLSLGHSLSARPLAQLMDELFDGALPGTPL